MATEENMFRRQLCTSPLQQTVGKHISMNKEGQQQRDDMKEDACDRLPQIFEATQINLCGRGWPWMESCFQLEAWDINMRKLNWAYTLFFL